MRELLPICFCLPRRGSDAEGGAFDRDEVTIKGRLATRTLTDGIVSSYVCDAVNSTTTTATWNFDKTQVFNANNQSRPFSKAHSPFLFTARDYDLETDIYHYRAHAYSPRLGRFVQMDPIDFDGLSLAV